MKATRMLSCLILLMGLTLCYAQSHGSSPPGKQESKDCISTLIDWTSQHAVQLQKQIDADLKANYFCFDLRQKFFIPVNPYAGIIDNPNSDERYGYRLMRPIKQC